MEHNELLEYAANNLLFRIAPSPISGVGLFALKPILAGTPLFINAPINEPAVVLIEDSELEIFSTMQQTIFFGSHFYKQNGKFRIGILPFEQNILRRYMNYSSADYNCDFAPGTMDIVCTKNIAVNEEAIYNENAVLVAPYGV